MGRIRCSFPKECSKCDFGRKVANWWSVSLIFTSNIAVSHKRPNCCTSWIFVLRQSQTGMVHKSRRVVCIVFRNLKHKLHVVWKHIFFYFFSFYMPNGFYSKFQPPLFRIILRTLLFRSFGDTYYLYGTSDIDRGLEEMGPPVVWNPRIS